jgi:acetylornithine deacetylase/succinyl-diaminopimelate desuccinylase-like protein
MAYYAKWFGVATALAVSGIVLSVGCSDAAAVNVQAKSEFNSDRAFGYLNAVCDLGPRPSGSAAMTRMQTLITEHCEKLGAKVERQSFVARHPQDGSPVTMTNLIVRWQPELGDRILLCAHYDTRPFPDRDPVRPRGVFLGANDGGSGVALCMEMAHAFSKEKFAVGVDFVLF